MDAEVRNATDRSRYELVMDGEVVGIADYHRAGDALIFPHTVIESDRRGQGLGEILLRGALDDVRSRGDKVVPQCWFVRDFFHANPEYSDLLAA